MVISSITADPLLQDLGERVGRSPKETGPIHVSGLWGSSAPFVATHLARTTRRPFLYLTAHLEQADNARDDLELFSDFPWDIFPAWEAIPGEGAADGEIEAERLRICAMLRGKLKDGSAFNNPPGNSFDNASRGASKDDTPDESNSRSISRGVVVSVPHIVAPIQALMQPVPTPDVMDRNTLRLTVNAAGSAGSADSAGSVVSAGSATAPKSPDEVLRWAVDRGFARLDLVESPGDVAQRGDIVDIFIHGESFPFRIQYDGEEIESIRRFDVSTQRSVETVSSITVTATTGRTAKIQEAAHILSYLPHDTIIVLDDPTTLQEMGSTLRARLGNTAQLFDVEEILKETAAFSHVYLSRFWVASTKDEAQYDCRVTSLTRFEGDAGEVVASLCQATGDYAVHVFCDNVGEQERLREMICEHLEERSAEGRSTANVHVHIGTLHCGFEWTATRTMVISHHELFHRHRPRRRVRKIYAGNPLDSWTDLKPGELVVHVMHGIGVYRGLKRLTKGDSKQQEEFLSVEFAESAMVHVPCSQIDLVQKYIGACGHKPTLSKLGGKRWVRSKEQVADAVAEMAESLLRIQAVRDASPGTAYPLGTQWQREFEAAFPYEETEDQLSVAEEIQTDLQRTRPMDRLVCGDVGYGKTELAMRAAFKIVEYGRQVAVLVPTTVLAEQHYATFRERMAEYPFTIGCLSRFRTDGEQRKLLEGVRKGQVDIVIGTHRLLSRDVSFADIGLVIIDEEQRFGVEHKEQLKAMRETVDVLTLTATPIPRTLDMALMGIRDISSLQTPPVDRRSIATQVVPFDRGLIRGSIIREINRDGQVFFVHNYVQSITGMAATIRSIVPEARVIYGHGQMKDNELEKVMEQFVRREADVLVSTTIIESGIDIPSANTIFINRADRFGLADLHQLRGRVGRSSHRAYCYLLLSPDHPPTSKAAKRLKTIEEFSELGAGFRIAMRDLEIRGAGNILGREQSGHIAVVGYEMYCRLLKQAVLRLKNEPDPSPPPVHVDLDVAAHLPQNYLASERSRIEVYRRIVSCTCVADIEQLEEDLVDAFGPFPEQVQRLLELAEIRVGARSFGIQSISLRPPDVVFIVKQLSRAESLFTEAQGTVRIVDDRTIHLRLPPAYLEPSTLLTALRHMLNRASAMEASS